MLMMRRFGGRNLGFRGDGAVVLPPDVIDPGTDPVDPPDPVDPSDYDVPTPPNSPTTVTNDSELTAALNAAGSSHQINLNGSFSSNRTFTIPGLVLKATSALSANVSGNWNFNATGQMAHGIDFRGTDKWADVGRNGAFAKFFRCRFRDNTPSGTENRLVSVRGTGAHFGACEFTNCNGTAIYFRIIGGDNGTFGKVERCYFHDINFTGDASLIACETDGSSLWVNGNQGGNLRYLNATITHNRFERVDVVGGTSNREMVMSKSNGNVIEYNTVVNCDGFINTRYTFDTTFRGNWIKDSFGLLTQGDGNVVVNNRLENCERGLWALGGRCTMDNIRQFKLSTGKWYHPAVRKSVYANNTTINTSFEVGRPNVASVDTFRATDIDIINHTGTITYGSLADRDNIRVTSSPSSAYPVITPFELTSSQVGRSYGL